MGKRLPLSNGRRLVDDVIHASKKMPMAAFSSDWDVQLISKLRRMARPKISWNVLMMKAHAIVCRQMPELRQIYVRYPWAHLYQHHQNVCMMTMGRQHEGEERLFFARFNEPDNQTLVELQEQYDEYRKTPVEEIKQFRHQLRFAKFPQPIRRFGWWVLFNFWPQKRASHMGTFGMSISGYRNAKASAHLGCNTTILGTDPTPKKGVAHMVLTFDHQIIDGTPATEAFMRSHRMLITAVAKELADMAGVNQNTLEPLSPHELEQIRIDFEQKRLESEAEKKMSRKEKRARVEARSAA